MPFSQTALRWTVAVLASAWFFPVSCITAAGVGTSIIADGDARDASRGDTVHGSIAVVVLPAPKPDQAFGYVLLNNVSSHKERHPDATFLMPHAAGQVVIGDHTRVSYKVIVQTATEQTIATEYHDGDRDAWGSYRATRSGVTPLTSRLFEVGYSFIAIPLALGFAFAVLFVARLVKRRMQRNAGT